jgi:hypothetical protein
MEYVVLMLAIVISVPSALTGLDADPSATASRTPSVTASVAPLGNASVIASTVADLSANGSGLTEIAVAGILTGVIAALGIAANAIRLVRERVKNEPSDETQDESPTIRHFKFPSEIDSSDSMNEGEYLDTGGRNFE